MYAAGDRVLIHANLDPGHRVFNGAIGTVVAVTATGIELSVEGGGDTTLPAAVVAGHRADRTPNVSHARARTVDGAQGGTWRHVHLLGTPALNRFTGYVGQSRGRHPTHTWNTRPETDHPARLLADQRTPTEVVLDAMGRAEPKTLAAGDDPWTIDRRLRVELDEHLTVAARRPPDRSRDLDAARHRLGLAHIELGRASTSVDYHRAERDRLGPLTRLRRRGHTDLARAGQALAGAHRRLDRATHELNDAAAAVVDLERAGTDRGRWDQTHGWRLDRITEIDDTLAHHWAQAVLRAVRADDPLAFGPDRLRQAHGLYTHDLHELRAGAPLIVASLTIGPVASPRRHTTIAGSPRPSPTSVPLSTRSTPICPLPSRSAAALAGGSKAGRKRGRGFLAPSSRRPEETAPRRRAWTTASSCSALRSVATPGVGIAALLGWVLLIRRLG